MDFVFRVPRFTSLCHLNRKTKMAKPANDHACQTLRQVTPKSCQAQPLVPRFTSPRHLNGTTKIAEPQFQGLQELPASLRELLAEAYAFFTSSHQLERAGKRVSLATYGKAQERILCEYCLFISLKYVMFGLFRISNVAYSIPREMWHKPVFAVLSQRSEGKKNQGASNDCFL